MSTRKESKPTMKDKASPARTLVITATITTKRLFHNKLSNDFLNELMLSTVFQPRFSDLRDCQCPVAGVAYQASQGIPLSQRSVKGRQEPCQHPHERSRLIRPFSVYDGCLRRLRADLRRRN